MKTKLLAALLFAFLLAGNAMAVFEYKNHNWSDVIAENANTTTDSALHNITAYYMANCSASYLLAIANGKPLENASIAIHKDQDRTLPAVINGTTDTNGIMKVSTGMGSAWINISKTGHNKFLGNTKIAHPPPCRQFSVNLKFDCTTGNATIIVTDNGIAAAGVKVMVSPMGVSNETDSFGKVTFAAFSADMVFVRVTDGDTSQLSVFEISECPKASGNTTITPQSVKPPDTVTSSQAPKEAKKEENTDILPVILALLVTVAAMLIVVKITKMEKNGNDENGAGAGK